MPRKLTKEIKYVRLPEERIQEIEDGPGFRATAGWA